MNKLLIILLVISLANFADVPRHVVVGKSSSRLERMALEELSLFWEKIYDVKLTVVEEENVGDKPALYLGMTDFAEKCGIRHSELGKEEWILKTHGDSVAVTGGRPAGTLYAVYALLEKLGVRFLTWDETVYPKTPPTSLPQLDERSKPAFDGRLIACRTPRELHLSQASPEVMEAFRKWLLRIRANGQEYIFFDVHYNGDMFRVTQRPQFHTQMCYLPAKKYFEAHPEYFSMNESGKRFAPQTYESGGGLCLSNPEVKALVLRSLQEKIDADRQKLPSDEHPVLYDFSVLDSISFLCCCPDCIKIRNEEGSDTGLLFRFVNELADSIRGDHPEIMLRTMAYGPVSKPVFKTRPANNLIVQLTDSLSTRDCFRPLSHQLNSERLAYFETWRKAVGSLWIWLYGDYSFNSRIPRVEVMIDSIAPDLRYLRTISAKTIFYEWERDYMAPQNFIDLQYYVAYRLMLNPDDDPDALAAEFINGYYGSAAPVVHRNIKEIREGVKAHPSVQSPNYAGTWAFFTPEFALRFYKDLKAASDSLPADSKYRRRIDFERITPIWEVLDKRFAYGKTFQNAGISLDSLADECRSLVNLYVHRFPAKKTAMDADKMEKRLRKTLYSVPPPERFKNVPPENIRILQAGLDGITAPQLNTTIASDPDAPCGKVLRSANKDDAFHGVAKVMPGKHKFVTTRFVFENFKGGGRTELTIKEIPQDEKYHWYDMPSAVTLTGQSYFWGHGWAINVPTTSVFCMTGTPREDNTYKCSFRAKFTGPAYVKDSSQQNAISIDQVILIHCKPE